MTLNTGEYNKMSLAQKNQVYSMLDAGTKSVSQEVFKPLTNNALTEEDIKYYKRLATEGSSMNQADMNANIGLRHDAGA
jgi:hypothetical protein